MYKDFFGQGPDSHRQAVQASLCRGKVIVIAPEVFSDAIKNWWTVTKHLCRKCVQTCFHKQLCSSLCTGFDHGHHMAGVSREAVDAHSAGTLGLVLVFIGP